ncbi:MAG TPA: helix-turn-helix transcriptional regulator [Acidimicrobiia bacterium]
MEASVGTLLRAWRQRRHLSQLEVATGAGVSARHLSFIETGRARPSREMVLYLAEHLDVPLRERNTLLLSAGFAPTYRETDLAAPEMRAVRDALDRVLAAHEPYPALVVDRRWNLVTANRATMMLLDGVDAALLVPPVSVLRLSLAPSGMAPRIANLGEWAEHLLSRLRRQVLLTGDEELAALEAELRRYPGIPAARHGHEGPGEIAVPLRLRTAAGGELRLLSTVATFGTAVDITVAELSIEAFFPADAATTAALRDGAEGRGGDGDHGPERRPVAQ